MAAFQWKVVANQEIDEGERQQAVDGPCINRGVSDDGEINAACLCSSVSIGVSFSLTLALLSIVKECETNVSLFVFQLFKHELQGVVVPVIASSLETHSPKSIRRCQPWSTRARMRRGRASCWASWLRHLVCLQHIVQSLYKSALQESFLERFDSIWTLMRVRMRSHRTALG